MNEKLTALLEEMRKNEKLQEEIKGVKDLDTLYAVTTKYVDGYTKDELKEGLKQLKKLTSDKDSELSDDELESVAGGSKGHAVVTVVKDPGFGDLIGFMDLKF